MVKTSRSPSAIYQVPGCGYMRHCGRKERREKGSSGGREGRRDMLITPAVVLREGRSNLWCLELIGQSAYQSMYFKFKEKFCPRPKKKKWRE